MINISTYCLANILGGGRHNHCKCWFDCTLWPTSQRVMVSLAVVTHEQTRFRRKWRRKCRQLLRGDSSASLVTFICWLQTKEVGSRSYAICRRRYFARFRYLCGSCVVAVVVFKVGSECRIDSTKLAHFVGSKAELRSCLDTAAPTSEIDLTPLSFMQPMGKFCLSFFPSWQPLRQALTHARPSLF